MLKIRTIIKKTFRLKNKIKQDQNGYVLVLTLMIISILVVIVNSMFFNETSHAALSSAMIKREKAKMLALGGVELALSKLSIKPPEKKDKAEKKTDKPPLPDKPDSNKDKNVKEELPKIQKSETNPQTALLKRLFPIINNWQTITLKKENDGIDGQIKFCICCEEGKLNINKIYDFSARKFKGPGIFLPGQTESSGNKFIETLSKNIQQYVKNNNMFNQLLEFLNKRKYPLNDVTELLEMSSLKYFQNHVFYEPPKDDEKDRPIFLTDIFTIWPQSHTLQPWLLSDSICAILGLKRAERSDIEQREKIINKLLKNFNLNIQWTIEWDKILKPVYKKDFKALPPALVTLLDTQFNPKFFSVISHGTVGDITQRIFAIIEIESNGANAKLRKLYWI